MTEVQFSAQKDISTVCLVYATMRNLAKKERLLEFVKELHRDTLEILQMDVTDQQSILDAKEKVVEKRVDILGMSSWVQTASFEMDV